MLLLPDFRSAAVCADRFADREFMVVYTSPLNGDRVALPPGRGSGTYAFTQAVRVALDVLARTPDWSAGDPPRIVSVDGLQPLSVPALGVVELGRMAEFLSAVAGTPMTLELPPVHPPRPEDDGDDD